MRIKPELIICSEKIKSTVIIMLAAVLFLSSSSFSAEILHQSPRTRRVQGESYRPLFERPSIEEDKKGPRRAENLSPREASELSQNKSNIQKSGGRGFNLDLSSMVASLKKTLQSLKDIVNNLIIRFFPGFLGYEVDDYPEITEPSEDVEALLTEFFGEDILNSPRAENPESFSAAMATFNSLEINEVETVMQSFFELFGKEKIRNTFALNVYAFSLSVRMAESLGPENFIPITQELNNMFGEESVAESFMRAPE
ncbi:MAG: hypothetical protein ACQESB_05515, partial [Elusimicrobiota bacterium]